MSREGDFGVWYALDGVLGKILGGGWVEYLHNMGPVRGTRAYAREYLKNFRSQGGYCIPARFSVRRIQKT